jgi:prevent-host-death family protein
MANDWQLQDAKNRFSELVNEAIAHGPQIITRRGAEVAVVLSYSDWLSFAQRQVKLTAFFQASPLAGVELERDQSQLRQIDELSA